jgi:hypothetical protein
MCDYIAGNMTFQKCGTLGVFSRPVADSWAKVEQGGSRKTSRTCRIFPGSDLLADPQPDQPGPGPRGSAEYIPPELQALWDSLLVIPLQDGDKLLGVLSPHRPRRAKPFSNRTCRGAGHSLQPHRCPYPGHPKERRPDATYLSRTPLTGLFTPVRI